MSRQVTMLAAQHCTTYFFTMLWPTVHLSVHHKLVFYQNELTNRAHLLAQRLSQAQLALC